MTHEERMRATAGLPPLTREALVTAMKRRAAELQRQLEVVRRSLGRSELQKLDRADAALAGINSALEGLIS